MFETTEPLNNIILLVDLHRDLVVNEKKNSRSSNKCLKKVVF